VTTTSPEAYRSYVEGLELGIKYYFPEAKAALERAIELDKNFAMAYVGLTVVRRGMGDFTGAREALEKAWELSDRVAERERLQIEAAYFPLSSMTIRRPPESWNGSARVSPRNARCRGSSRNLS